MKGLHPSLSGYLTRSIVDQVPEHAKEVALSTNAKFSEIWPGFSFVTRKSSYQKTFVKGICHGKVVIHVK